MLLKISLFSAFFEGEEAALAVAVCVLLLYYFLVFGHVFFHVKIIYP